MSTRRLKNLLKRQFILSIRDWTGIQMKKARKTLKEETNYLQSKTSQWGAQQMSGVARLGQKLYT